MMSKTALEFPPDTLKLAMQLLGSEELRDRDPNIFHASQAGECRRQQIIYLDHWREIGRRIDTIDSIRRMAEGKWSHVKWQLIFHHMGILERCEFQVRYAPWNTGGAPDGVLVLPWINDETRFLVEVKGVSDYRFGNILRTNAPEANHILQTHTYIQALDYSNIIYIYENKNTQDWKIFYQKRDIEIVKFLRKRYRYMNAFHFLDTLPPPDCTFSMTDKMYRWCPAKNFCKQNLRSDM